MEHGTDVNVPECGVDWVGVNWSEH